MASATGFFWEDFLSAELEGTLPLWHVLVFCAAIMLLMQLLQALIMTFGNTVSVPPHSLLPKRGKHLDELSTKDIAFITWNTAMTGVYVFQLAQFCWSQRHAGSTVSLPAPQALLTGVLGPNSELLNVTSGDEITAGVIGEPGSFSAGGNAAFWAWFEFPLRGQIVFDWPHVRDLALVVPLFVVYEFFYTIFHRILHLRQFYAFVHKHHHRQKAPSRGQHDAVNVHPFEFFVGEYNHMFALFLVSRLRPVNIVAALVFQILGGVLASLNHTRFDVRFPVLNFVFQSRYHDIHHFYPKANFCQYTVLWDWLFGWFLPYPDDEVSKAKWALRKGAARAKAE